MDISNLWPNFSNIIASSTEWSLGLGLYMRPVIYIVFGVVVVVALINLLIGLIYWIGYKIENLTTHGRAKHLRENAREDAMDILQNDADWHLWRKSKGYE